MANVKHRFLVIGITLRRRPEDRPYRVLEAYDVDSLELACELHASPRRRAARCTVLRDGLTGARYSMAASREVCERAAAAGSAS